MKLVLVSFLVIFSGDCHGFPDGLEARNSANRAQRHTDGSLEHNSVEEDQHFQDEIESGIYVDNDQHLEKGRAVNEKAVRGNSAKKILQKLLKDLQSVREKQDNQDSKLDSISSDISNQDSKLDSISSDISNQDSKLVAISSDISNQDSKLDSLSSAISNQDSKLNSMSSAISNISAKLEYITGCPPGFFVAGSQQCFKYFNTTKLSWTSAKAKCQSEGLIIAKPNDPVSLRMHLKDYDSGEITWIGARGAGSYFRWDRDGQQISNTNSLWWPNKPGSALSTSYCLSLPSGNSNPNQPYYPFSCSNVRSFACERVMN